MPERAFPVISFPNAASHSKPSDRAKLRISYFNHDQPHAIVALVLWLIGGDLGMCGRYKMTAEQLELFDSLPYLIQDDYFDIHGYKKRPEIFPGTSILAVNNAQRAEDLWWTVEDRDYKGVWRKAINARAETISFVDMFKNAFLNDRVLIPATALFEWQTQPDKTKKKFEIWFDEPVFTFAGIARDCEIKGETKRCGAIITGEPNDVFAEIHNAKQRQAVVIRSFDRDKWLDPETPVSELKRLLHPLPNEETHWKQVE